MNNLKSWWSNDLSRGVKIVLLVLLANGLPAFIILMTLPGMTDLLFVWTIKPVINARLIGVMYANAMLLVGFSAFQTEWKNVRTNLVVITLFSVFATTLTFFFLKPFLAHPWYHLAYWLTMYLVLFFAAPYVFFTQEKKHGGKLPIQVPLNFPARLIAGIFSLTSLVIGLGLIFKIDLVNLYWPWTLPPLVGGLIGVLFLTHAAAYAWAVWDGDWLRTRSIFWQAPLTALLFILLPLLHPGDLNPDPGNSLLIYILITGIFGFSFLAVILGFQKRSKGSENV
jgi:hypothetical protein